MQIFSRMSGIISRILLRVVRYLQFGKDKWQTIGNDYFRKHIADPSFEAGEQKKKINPYFLRWGFNVNMEENEYYSRYTGISSDLYVPCSIYYHFIQPFLNQNSLRTGFVDKNNFEATINYEYVSKHHGIVFPRAYVYNTCGVMMDGSTRDSISIKDAIHKMLEINENFIIKPTRDSTWGNGVRRINKEELSESFLESLFTEYGENFICQELVRQHPVLAKYNPTSVNSVRLTTYRNFNGEIRFLYAFFRYGSKGAVVDNASAGGYMYGINEKGNPINRRLLKFGCMKEEYLNDEYDGCIPYFKKIVEACKYLHSRIPQFALIGWDMTIDIAGNPVFIEYNISPSIEGPQMTKGPVWSKDELDEIMKRVSKYQYSYSFFNRISWPDKKGHECVL